MKLKGYQIGAKRLEIGEGVSNRGKKISNRDRDYKSVKSTMLCVEGFLNYLSLRIIFFSYTKQSLFGFPTPLQFLLSIKHFSKISFFGL